MADDKAGLIGSGEVGLDPLHEADPEQRLYFKDGKRRIDFMLAYMHEHEDDDDEEKKLEKFETFLENLKANHLELEEADDMRKNGYGSIPEGEHKEPQVRYIKIHAPFDVLCESAEDLKMKMPMCENDIDMKEWYEDNAFYRFLERNNPFRLRDPHTFESKKYFTGTFDHSRFHEFINHENPDKFFTPAERGRLVFFILEKTPFGDDPVDIGIGHLIHKGVFLDAYPLHDGPVRANSDDPPVNERQNLEADWASVKCLFRFQPIDAIKEYFGEKIALYFAWLGVYTTFLVPAAIVGVLCFIYGIATAFDYVPVKETCHPDPLKNGMHRLYMCPLCDKTCSYYLLDKIGCMYAKITHFFDNEATIFFAVFMAIWSTLFLEFWKRKQVSLAYEWSSMGFEETEERVRPEYAAANKTLKSNPVTGMMEPYMPTKAKMVRVLGTIGVVTFFVLLVLVAVVGVILFRAFFAIVLISAPSALIRERSSLVVSAVAGLLNLVAINILKFLYKKVAVVLTDWENPRTRTDYEDSFTVKMFLFQFFNTYSSIFYIAFFKSEVFVGSPGKYTRIGDKDIRLNGCSVQGCFLELTIQLVIIMVGQQIVGNVMETLLPSLQRWYKDRQAKKEMVVVTEEPQWVDDFQGEMQTKFSLFWEYLEIVLQYGFVTMFVAAFPLAPFFALLNNVIEIRVDSYNYIFNCRRPVAQRAEDIGAWYGILASLTKAAIVISACVLAFTSELIPKLTYKYFFNQKDSTLHGFVDFSLSRFNVSYFTPESRPMNATKSGIPVQPFCRYPGYHDDTFPFDRNIKYWVIQAARLCFILVFVAVVLLFTWIVGYVVPDIPKTLELRIKREKFLAEQAEQQFKEKVGKRKPRHKKEKSPLEELVEDGEVSTSPV